MTKFKTFTLFICLLFATSLIAQKKIAVMDLRPLGPVPRGDINVLSERFRSQLVQTRIFEVMERNELEALDQELALQLSDGFDEKAVAEAGLKQGAELVVLGYIGKLQSTYTIDVRMVNCTTSKIDNSYSETYKGDIEGLIALMEKLAKRMAGIEEKSNLWMYLTGGGVVTVATIAYLIWGVEEDLGLPEPPGPPE
jgi:TolB-like protein